MKAKTKKVNIESLMTISDWKGVWAAQKAADASLLIIFKRAPACPSALVIEERFLHWLEGLGQKILDGIRVVTVHVVNERPVSKRVEKDTGVKHESPQALVFDARRKPVWSASHGAISEAALARALASTRL